LASYGLGVDLGTSFTSAAVHDGGTPRMVTLGEHSTLVPSVVRIHPDGTLHAGHHAGPPIDEASVLIAQDFKRRLGDPTPPMAGGRPQSAVSLMAATLDAVVDTVTALEGAPPDRVVLTYPAVWGQFRREQFYEVRRQVGLDAVNLLTEAAAAATHYAGRRGLTDGAMIGVYDLGGATFDTSVTRVTSSGLEIVGVPQGLEWIGGAEFDKLVMGHVDRAVGGALSRLEPHDPATAVILQRVRTACVRAKEALSTEDSASISVQLDDRQTEVPLSRAQFESLIHAPLKSTLVALHRALDSAEVTPDQLDGFLLIGGSAEIPLVAELLSADLGRAVFVDPQPQYCIALGAAALSRPQPLSAVAGLLTPTHQAAPVAAVAVPMAAGAAVGTVPVTVPAQAPSADWTSTGDSDSADLPEPASDDTAPINTLLPPIVSLNNDDPSSTGEWPASTEPGRARPTRWMIAALVAALLLIVAGIYTFTRDGDADTRQNQATGPVDPNDPASTASSTSAKGAPGATGTPSPTDAPTTQPGTTPTTQAADSRPESSTTVAPSTTGRRPVTGGAPPAGTVTSTSRGPGATTAPAAPLGPQFQLQYCNNVLGATLSLQVNGGSAGGGVGTGDCSQAQVPLGAGFQVTLTRNSDGSSKTSQGFTQPRSDGTVRAVGLFAAPSFFYQED
jgi:molecular chaperone DnaK